MSAAVTGLAASFAIQRRVIFALAMREFVTRFGRHNIGFLWLFLEPIIFTLGVVVLWTVTRDVHGFRVDIAPFVVTGYSSLLLWRNCSFRGMKAVEPNRALTYHRNVRVIDIFAARLLLEVAAVTASFVSVLLVMWGFDLIRAPRDIALMMAGWFFLAWFSIALGTILGCLSEYTDVVERVWHPISYFMLTISGAFFMVDWIPSGLRPYAVYVPMLNAVEMLRGGYYGSSVVVYYSIPVVLATCMVMSLLSLLLVREVQRMLREKG